MAVKEEAERFQPLFLPVSLLKYECRCADHAVKEEAYDLRCQYRAHRFTGQITITSDGRDSHLS